MPIKILPKDPIKKEKPNWITKKEKPKAWITKKEKPKAWITKKEKPKAWITKKKKELSSGLGQVPEKELPKRPQGLGYRKGGHVNTRRENRLEELGRVDAEKAYTSKGKRNLKAEKKRIVGELKRKKYNIGGRANLLEEMGRIDARRHPDRADRAEKRRVIRELNKGYNSGGVVLKGKKVGCQIK